MKSNRTDNPYPIVTIEDFIPNESLVRAASESYDFVDNSMKLDKDVSSAFMKYSMI